ncbi:MAG: Ornithine/acetylornithine aminotransferase argD [Candidatus Methanohalarchaeum thermophilum]|uniref:Ornithine/acetylornithine aminotransferase argD n=1 Tax=Methanohalarchaeum thermophilum TaxID=1903181 RepID=A0A1Q6DTJ9_METT1|nr:MAG: Ornithine/acetylornithine aminotransferase argD [Candidatus Methanohalarchaeum thermophilum]
MDKKEIKELTEENLINVYNRLDLAPVEAEGSRLVDSEGNEYIDFVGGIAVNSVGHCHPKVAKAIKDQSENLIHCSNLYYIEKQAKLGKKLSEISCFDKFFFVNSGTEAVESALKLARKASDGTEILAAENSFHGRTFGSLSGTWKERYRNPFKPLVPDFRFIEYDNRSDLNKEITEETAAVILEPIQGEGGINVPSKDYIKHVRKKCNETSTYLIFDEVQAGMGRTGKLFGYEHYDVEPDMISLAKSLGGGFPIGAMGAKKEIAEEFEPGDHASTFGGNPLACSASLASINVLVENNLPERARKLGKYMKSEIKEKIVVKKDWAKEIRGKGLMLALETDGKAKEIVEKGIEEGFLLNNLGDNTIRFVPPIIIGKEEIDKVVSFLAR